MGISCALPKTSENGSQTSAPSRPCRRMPFDRFWEAPMTAHTAGLGRVRNDRVRLNSVCLLPDGGGVDADVAVQHAPDPDQSPAARSTATSRVVQLETSTPVSS